MMASLRHILSQRNQSGNDVMLTKVATTKRDNLCDPTKFASVPTNNFACDFAKIGVVFQTMIVLLIGELVWDKGSR